ncbi:hypothetical protein OFR41_01925 [Brachyspira hyodysenteriae]|uniref:hypothetical protein n=1 Tax=Brachyspira hyodysenteriae TaxID=159 RepID=UPI001183C5FD|nr:hypothetical protein [Brachyspira hyodysenteriae]MDA0033903.1 hypothetical protein [Brachyspira hyodysenteriae]MDA0047973.1 hypothetical protein [Brachyspira hyodysenteriae]MDA1468655.1 hypothetical protein [Brachyspira hyodysenteriae]TVL71675.1 hypothetical protein A9X74_06740 [Brachyspira hyodysenteriae]TVL74614.1 hypothetical protein A9X76_07620 [Brachyspira hyodysenteriae]
MSENKLMNLSSKKRLYHILVFTIIIISSLPISIQILLYDIDHNADNFYSTIIINSFYYQVFYFFSYSFLFIIDSNLENINKRTILIIFLSFLLLFLLGIFTSAPLKDEIPAMLEFFKSNIMINKSILSSIIFFIIIVLSDNNFNIKNNTYNSFTKLGDIILFSVASEILLATILFLIIKLVELVELLEFLAIMVLLFFGLMLSVFSEEHGNTLASKLILIFIVYLSTLIPFIIFFVQKRFKTVLSIYISRGLLFLYSFLIFALFFALLYQPIRPFDNTKSFIIYNVLLILSIITLYFIRADYKAGIITKAMYIIFPIIALLFNILVLGASIYRVIISENKINEISIAVLNIIIAVNLVYIIIQNIKSIIKILKNNININEAVIGNNKIYSFIYVYGIYSFIFSFIAPIVMVFLKDK